MKRFLILFFLIVSEAITAQAVEFAGIYILKEEGESGITQHKMALHEEGTFLFSVYFSPNEIEGSILEISSMYGSGKWRTNGNELFFTVDRKEDFDKDRILDFSNTRARIQKSSPANTDGITSTQQLVFFDSNISWVKGLILNKE